MPTLAVRFRGETIQKIELGATPLRLGRADNCDVVLRKQDSEVSREHAKVWLDTNGQVLVADLGSKNGTRVDSGDAFKSTTKIAQRMIRLGEHELEILDGTGDPATRDSGPMFAEAPPTKGGDTHFFPSSKKIDLSQQRLTVLMNLAQRLGATFERKQLLEQAIDACCDALGFERGLIAVKTPRGDTELPVTRNIQRDEHGVFKVSRTLINRALVHGERAIVNNPATDLIGDLSESMVRFPICSALCVPITNREEILGVVYGDRITRASTYSPEDVDFFAAIAQQVGLGLANLRLFQEHLRSQRVYAEIEQARSIQQRLLPAAPLQLGRVEIEGYNEPSSAVGGDYFDCFELASGRIGFIIADVTGHGLPAALLMTNLQAAVHVALSGRSTLPEIAVRINQLICRNTSDSVFITAIMGTIDPATGVMEFVNAGHWPPLFCGDAPSPEKLEHNSLPFGLDEIEGFEVRRYDPGPGAASVLLYTDGLVEASNPAGDALGLDALRATVERESDKSSAGLIRAARGVLSRHVAGTDLADDMTLLAVHFNPLR